MNFQSKQMKFSLKYASHSLWPFKSSTLSVALGGTVRTSFLFQAAILVVLTASGECKNPQLPNSPFDPKHEPSILERQVAADEDVISGRELILFHELLVTHCMPAMPDEVTLQYAGLVALDNGRAKQRIHG